MSLCRPLFSRQPEGVTARGAFLYIFFGGLWIVLSNHLVEDDHPPEDQRGFLRTLCHEAERLNEGPPSSSLSPAPPPPIDRQPPVSAVSH